MNPVAVKILVLPAMLASFAFNSLLSVKPVVPAPKGWERVEPNPEQADNKPKFDVPDKWEPAEKVLPKSVLYESMFMGVWKRRGKDLYYYKHEITRRYIYIDRNGLTYSINGERIPKDEAIRNYTQ